MPVRSVLTIDVDDAAFKAFHQSFNLYQQALAKTPIAWNQVSGAVKSTAFDYEKLASLMLAQNEHLAKLLTGQNAFGRAIGDSNRHMTALERTVQSVSRHITDATRSILKWGTISSALAGLAGFGGLFGIRSLAQGAAGDYKTATGLGVSPGQLRSLQAVFPYLTDPGALLRSAATGKYGALSEEGKAQTLLGIGHGGDPFDIAMRTLEAAQKFAIQHRNDPLMMNTPQAQLFGQLGIGLEEFNRLRAMTPGQLREQEQEARGFAGRAEQDRETSEAWTKLMITLNEAGALIEKSFVVALKGLAGPITDLSKAFARAVEAFLNSNTVRHWIDVVGQGLDWLAKNIDTPEFQKSITDFAKNVGEVADALGRILMGLKPIADWLWPKPTEGEKVGPGETLTPWGKGKNPLYSYWEKFKQLWDDMQEAEGHGRPSGTLPPNAGRADIPGERYRPFGPGYVGPLGPIGPAGTTLAKQVELAGSQQKVQDYIALIHKYENRDSWTSGVGGKDLSHAPLDQYGFPIWEGKGDSHAAGGLQFQPGEWAKYAGPLGIHDFSEESQRRVGIAALLKEGMAPWAPYNRQLAEALRERARDRRQVAPAAPAPTANRGDQHAALPQVRIFVDNRTGGSAVISGSQLGAVA